MPLLSWFTPLGLLKLSGKPSRAQLFYDQMVASVGGQLSTDAGTHVEASIYARAMACGRASVLLEHACDQQWPSRALELIPSREREYGLVPAPTDTITDRREALAAARLLPRGACAIVLQELFGAAFGDDFLFVRAAPSDEAVNYPEALGDAPMNLQATSVPRKFICLLDSVTGAAPAAHTLRYEALDPNESTVDETQFDITKQIATTRLLVGDVVVIDSETPTRTEAVAVTAAGVLFSDGDVLNDPAYRTFTGVITQTHAAGASATTIPFPLWASSKRHYTIVLTEDAAADAETRRKANELAARVFAGVATWSVGGGAGSSAGPFTIGVGMLGITPIGTIVP